ncbi:MAG: sigma-70 family RNA polymerase sigma factor [Phycisphaerae bacterium]|nr:sigma-70 family RNA polymerase sigma factor [Phycisphaerae bacterium]
MPDAKHTSEEPSDAELLQQYIAGDAAAFSTLIGRYRRELFTFLMRFTADAALAEDAFQEAFLQVHLSAGAFDPTRRFKPWLFTIAANKARDAMRWRRRRHAAPLDATVEGETGDADTYGSLMPADVPPPAESLSNQETRRRVQNIVSDMPDHLRLVLLLSYFHDMPYKDIAEALDVPLGTVKSRLHAAVRHFARRWKGADEGPDDERQSHS